MCVCVRQINLFALSVFVALVPETRLGPVRIPGVVSWQWARFHDRHRLGRADKGPPSALLCAFLCFSLGLLQCGFSEKWFGDEKTPDFCFRQKADNDTDTYA